MAFCQSAACPHGRPTDVLKERLGSRDRSVLPVHTFLLGNRKFPTQNEWADVPDH